MIRKNAAFQRMYFSLLKLPEKMLNRMEEILDKNKNSVKVYLLRGTCPDEEGIETSAIRYKNATIPNSEDLT